VLRAVTIMLLVAAVAEMYGPAYDEQRSGHRRPRIDFDFRHPVPVARRLRLAARFVPMPPGIEEVALTWETE